MCFVVILDPAKTIDGDVFLTRSKGMGAYAEGKV